MPNRVSAAADAAKQLLAGETNAQDTQSLAGILYRTYLATYEATLTDEARRAGGALTARLTNPDVQEELAILAEENADKIVSTYQADFERFLGSLPTGITDADAARAIATWDARRDTWKASQIAVTEAGRARGLAQRAFIDRGDATGYAIFGGSTKCALCQKIASENPYDLDDPRVGTLGHPSCADSWITHYRQTGALWRGD